MSTDRIRNPLLLAVWLGAFMALLAAPMAVAQETRTASPGNPDRLARGGSENIEVPIFRSQVMRLDAPASRVSVGNPDIADILIIRANQLYVVGQNLGTTNVMLWDANDRLVGTVNVEVTHDLESLKAKLHTLLPNEDIEVYSSQRSIVLRGRVSSITNMDVAKRIARSYLLEVQDGGVDDDAGTGTPIAESEIINQMQVAGAQQVMLEVTVAEISRSVLKRLDSQINAIYEGSNLWNFGGTTRGAASPSPGFDGSSLAAAQSAFNPGAGIIERSGLFSSFLSNSFLFDLIFDAAKENNMARILAEPTLTTLTGEEASFLSGGEFPIPVPGERGQTTIEFREFGVGLGFLPIVLGDGIINAKLSVSVSELIDRAVTALQPEGTESVFIVPSLTKRSASVTVELREGQTLGIAGLIDENTREVASRFPGLGDIPVLGQLFRSQQFIRDETELVILVTPHLAKPIERDQIRLPTDGYQEPGDFGFFLLGRMSDDRRGPRRPVPQQSGGTEGSYGHRME